MEGKLIIHGEVLDVKVHNCELAHKTVPEVGIGIYSNIDTFEKMMFEYITKIKLPNVHI